MPLYSFRDKNTDEVFDVRMNYWTEVEPYLAENPHIERYWGPGTAPSIVSGVSVRDKVGGFREVLSKVAEAHPDSQVAHDHGRKSVKQVQTDRAVQKWRSKSGSTQ